ncbi:MAG: hypothetical protein K2I00_08405 [Ruminococcus sp.]|nr:hypothetical protein [Ruminococcus sp.]
MEFEKEFEKFSFGIGNEKTAGSGKIIDIVSKKSNEYQEKKTKQLIAEIIAEIITVIIGITVTIIKIKNNKKTKEL